MNSNQRCCDLCDQPWNEHGANGHCPPEKSHDLRIYQAGEAAMREKAAAKCDEFSGYDDTGPYIAEHIRELPLSTEVPDADSEFAKFAKTLVKRVPRKVCR